MRAYIHHTYAHTQVVFYDQGGGVERTFDYSNDPKCKEFTCAAFNPTGESVVVGNFDSFYTYSLNNRTETWDDIGIKSVPNLYTVTALAWKRDGEPTSQRTHIHTRERVRAYADRI